MNQGQQQGMTVIVKTVTKLTLGFILLYGLYIALNGHRGPGGGFAGGVIVAISLVHVMLAFGKEVALRRLHSYILRVLAGASALAFLYIVMAHNSMTPSRIFNNDIIIPLCEAVIVGFGLFAIFIALVLLSKLDKDAE